MASVEKVLPSGYVYASGAYRPTVNKHICYTTEYRRVGSYMEYTMYYDDDNFGTSDHTYPQGAIIDGVEKTAVMAGENTLVGTWRVRVTEGTQIPITYKNCVVTLDFNYPGGVTSYEPNTMTQGYLPVLEYEGGGILVYDGEWKEAACYEYDGEWKETTVYARDGEWKEGL